VPATVVPDASVAAKWYLDDEEDTHAARAIHRRFEDGTLALVVPDSFFYELGALTRRAERRVPPRLTADQATAIYERIATLTLETYSCQHLLVRAAARSRELEVSLYDALYLVLADLTQATFVTADGKLFERIKHLPRVTWISAWQDPATSPAA
jgi:predicted nucleic acid-binding protein